MFLIKSIVIVSVFLCISHALKLDPVKLTDSVINTNLKTHDGSFSGQGLPLELDALFQNDEETTTRKVARKNYALSPVAITKTQSDAASKVPFQDRIPPAYVHLYSDAPFRRGRVNFNIDDYVPPKYTDYQAAEVRIKNVDTNEIPEVTTLPTSTTTLKKLRRRRPSRRRNGKRPVRPMNGKNATYRRRPDFPNRIPPAYRHLYRDTTILPTVTLSETTINQEKIDAPLKTTEFQTEKPQTTTLVATTQTTDSLTTVDQTTQTDFPEIQLPENDLKSILLQQNIKLDQIEQRIQKFVSGIDLKLLRFKVNFKEVMDELKSLKTQNGRLDSALWVVRRNFINLKNDVNHLIRNGPNESRM